MEKMTNWEGKPVSDLATEYLGQGGIYHQYVKIQIAYQLITFRRFGCSRSTKKGSPYHQAH